MNFTLPSSHVWEMIWLKNHRDQAVCALFFPTVQDIIHDQSLFNALYLAIKLEITIDLFFCKCRSKGTYLMCGLTGDYIRTEGRTAFG